MGRKMSKEIQEYIDKQKSPQKEICTELRKIVLKTFPEIEEEMRWGVPVYGKDKYYIGALRDHVNMGFKIEGLSNSEKKLFEGSGKTMRHIKLHSVEDIDENEIVRLMKLVAEEDRDEQE